MKVIDNNLKEWIKFIKKYKKIICTSPNYKPVFKELYKIKDIEKCKTIAEKYIKNEDIISSTLIKFLFITPYKIISYNNKEKNTEEWKKEWGDPDITKLSIKKLKKILKKEKWNKIELQIYNCLWISGEYKTTVIIEK